MLEGNTGPDSYSGPPHPTDVPEATSEHSSEGTSAEDSHPVRREHRLCAGHGAMVTHPTGAGTARRSRFYHPATRCCFAVCKSIADLFANRCCQLQMLLNKHFLTKLGLDSNPLLLFSRAAPCRTARRGPQKGSRGARCWAARGWHRTRGFTGFRHIPALSPSPQLLITLTPDKGIN